MRTRRAGQSEARQQGDGPQPVLHCSVFRRYKACARARGAFLYPSGAQETAGLGAPSLTARSVYRQSGKVMPKTFMRGDWLSVTCTCTGCQTLSRPANQLSVAAVPNFHKYTSVS